MRAEFWLIVIAAVIGGYLLRGYWKQPASMLGSIAGT